VRKLARSYNTPLEIEVDHRLGTVRVFTGSDTILEAIDERCIRVREKNRHHYWCECGHSIHEGQCTAVAGEEQCGCDEFTPEGTNYKKKIEHRVRHAFDRLIAERDIELHYIASLDDIEYKSVADLLVDYFMEEAR